MQPGTLKEMMDVYQVASAIPGRPWTSCEYGLGLMCGEVGEVGRVIGHSGTGPFCANAVYHFPGIANPVTVASFTEGCNEAPAEFEAVRLALESSCLS